MCLALVHHQVRKVLMHNSRLIDCYIYFSPCPPHPMQTFVGTSIGIGGVGGGVLLTGASINMCYIRFNSPIMHKPSHFRPYTSTTLGTEHTEPTNYDRQSRKRTALVRL